MVLGQITAVFLPTLTMQVLLYGVLGGASTGFTISIINTYTSDNFEGKPRIFEATLQVARAFTLFVMPHIVLFLVNYYNIFRAQALFSGFMLHAIPIGLVACRKKEKVIERHLTRYKTVPGYLFNEDSIELPTINRFSNGITNPAIERRNSQEDDGDSSTSSDDSYTFTEIKDHDSILNQQFRMKTEMGVEILPEIPEEDESELKEYEKLNSNLKRLSRISSKFEEVIDKDDRNSGLFLEPSNLDNSVRKRHSYFGEFKRKGQTECCSPYQKYLFRRRMRMIGNLIWDELLKPLNTSFKTYYFYPSLFGKTCMSLSYAIYISTITHIALVNGASYKIDVNEAVFLLTFISVAWCFFLISLPWGMNLAKTKLKLLHVFGLLVTSGSFSMIYISQSHDMITLSCLVFGLGYGTISFSENLVYEESLGPRRYPVVLGTLETLSGLFVIVIYFVIYMFKLSISNLFLLFYVFISMNCLLWILTPLANYVWVHVRKKRDDSLRFFSRN
ncbi:uncharacterized protein [Onthophagus taurus]